MMKIIQIGIIFTLCIGNAVPDISSYFATQDKEFADFHLGKEITDTTGNKVFIDRVHYFPLTGEAYVWVDFNEHYDWKALDTLKYQADSVLMDDGEIRRTNFPIKKAEKYFDLTYLDGISIFNYAHEFQGKSRLKRIEYFEDVLGDQVIAILETPNKLKGDRFYGINGHVKLTQSIASKEIENANLLKSVKDLIGIKSHYDWRLNAIRVEPYGITYAFYSFAAQDGKEKSFLLEKDNDSFSIVQEITNDYSIWEVCPMPIEVNQRPVLLLKVGVPETDLEWYSPAIFDGEKFDIPNSRIIDIAK